MISGGSSNRASLSNVILICGEFRAAHLEAFATMVFKLAEGAQKSWRRFDGHNQLPKLIQRVNFATASRPSGRMLKPLPPNRARHQESAIALDRAQLLSDCRLKLGKRVPCCGSSVINIVKCDTDCFFFRESRKNATQSCTRAVHQQVLA